MAERIVFGAFRMFHAQRLTGPDLEALSRVEDMVRDRFSIAENEIVLVSEEPTRESGLPPVMTTIRFWLGREARHKLRVFKPVSQVAKADLPHSWLRGALLDEGDGDCC